MPGQRSIDAAHLAHVREIDLAAVMQSLGAEQDRHDRAKWRLDGHVISITGGQFFDHLHERGGGGAIDLVMHVRGVSFVEAFSYLDGRPWPAGRVDGTRQVGARAQQTRGAMFVPPAAREEHWAAVRTYLVEERALPNVLVDALHTRGLLYADERHNAVFPRRDLQGRTTGAALRGTSAGSRFKGLAAGTERAAGWFHFAAGDQGAPQMVLAESAIDTLSYYALIHGACPPADRGYRELYVATDGAGALPHPLIAWTLEHGGLVRVAFDRDHTGERLWQHLQDRYAAGPGGDPTRLWREPPPLGKDWNDVLRARIREQSHDDHGR